MRALIATDLDRTLIYSRAAGAADTDRCVEIYDGAPLSYLTESAATLLTELAARVPVVPVTTRTRPQFERISLPGGPFHYAVVSSGGRILRDGVERARAKLEYTPLATAFCAPEFTISELRRVCEVVWGTRLDPRNFHRKVTGTEGFVEETAGTTTRDGGRPARLYRAGRASTLYPPLLR